MNREQRSSVTLEELEGYLAGTKSRMPGVRVAEMLQSRALPFDRPSQVVDLMTRTIATLKGPEDESELPGGRRGSRRQKSHSILLLTRAFARCIAGDHSGAEADAAEALELARKLDDHNLEGTTLNLQGTIAVRTHHIKRAEELFTSAFEIGTRTNDADVIVRSMDNLAGLYDLQGDTDKSIRLSGVALEHLRKLENAEWSMITLLTNRGRAFFEAERFPEALDAYREAQLMARRHGHIHNEIRAQEGCAHVYVRLGNYADALEECRHALNLATEKSIFGLAAYIESTIGSIYVLMEDDRTAEEAYARSIDLARMAGNVEGVLRSRVGLAEIALRAGKGEEALATFQEALNFYEHRTDASTTAYFRSRIANALRELGRIAEAEESYLRAIAVAKEMKTAERIAVWSSRLGELYVEMGDDHKALACFEQALANVDEKSPSKPVVDLYESLIDVYERTGRPGEALDVCRRHRNASAHVATRMAGEELRKARVLYEVDTLRNDAELARGRQLKAEEDLKEGECRLEQAIFQMEEMREMTSALREDLKTALAAFGSAHVEEGIALLKRVQRSLDHDRGSEESELTHLSSIDKAFRERLQASYPTLTATQVRLCGLLHAGYPNKTIASILHITSGAVKKSRYRLRAIFGLDGSERLETFLAGL